MRPIRFSKSGHRPKCPECGSSQHSDIGRCLACGAKLVMVEEPQGNQIAAILAGVAILAVLIYLSIKILR